MHILLIHQAFAEIDEAGGTRHHELARHLATRGHRVTIIGSPVSYLTGKVKPLKSSEKQNKETDPGITIIRVNTFSALHRSFVHRVFSFISFMVSSFFAGLAVEKVDLVWGTSPPIFQSLTAWLLARLKGVPFLFEVRDLWPAFAIDVGVLKNRLLISLSLWLESFLYRHADTVMVNSPGFIEHVTSKGAKKVVLLPNGVDPEMFDPKASGAAFRNANHLRNKFVVMYAGAHGMSNDLDVVLKAAELLKEEEDIQFVLVGDGKEKPALIQKAQDLQLTNIHFHPPLAKKGMKDVLAAADACLAILKPIELYKTTYPNKVFDYMAAGKPVILAIDGVIRDVVEKAGAGVFTRPGDPAELLSAIKFLKKSPAKRTTMGRSGREYVVEHFNRMKISERLDAILKDIIDEFR